VGDFSAPGGGSPLASFGRGGGEAGAGAENSLFPPFPLSFFFFPPDFFFSPSPTLVSPPPPPRGIFFFFFFFSGGCVERDPQAKDESPATQPSDSCLRKKKNADAQAAFRAKSATTSPFEETGRSTPIDRSDPTPP